MNRRALLTGLAILVLFFYVINIYQFSQPTTREISYSQFLEAIDDNIVASVTISGERLTGITIDNQKIGTIFAYDPNLIQKLRNHQVQISVKPDDSTPWYWHLLIQWGPVLLLIGVMVFIMKKMPGGGGGKLMNISKSKAKRYEDDIYITFDNVAGVEEAKEELVEIVDFLRDPGKFQKLGGKIPKGVLMVGPPGTGKTLLAKAVAGEAGVPFFSISGSDFVEMFVGVGASRVRDLFKDALESAPCIIFIDEIDAVGRHRGAGSGGGNDEREQTLNALLVEMDGFDGTEGIITIAATNRADILDPALKRPGRFDREVTVALPDIKGRLAILKVHGEHVALKEGTNMESIAKGTPGFSGAELANLINESALHAAKQNKSEIELEDLEWARDKVMMGAERRSMIMTAEEKEETAYHEAGHALVAAYCKKADPVHKITIIPRGQALGMTAYLPDSDRLSMDKEYLLDRVRTAMGGKAAEEICMNNTTTGVEGDLNSATNIVYRMICEWGMSNHLGALSIPMEQGNQYGFVIDDGVSDEVLDKIDKEANEILSDAYEFAKNILTEHRDQLDSLAKLLLEQETVNRDEFLELIGQAPDPVPEDTPKAESEEKSDSENAPDQPTEEA